MDGGIETRLFDYRSTFKDTGQFVLTVDNVGAVALTGWGNRARLISALLKVGHGQTGWSPFRLLRRTGREIFMPHPSIADRAEVLQVGVPQIGRHAAC